MSEQSVPQPDSPTSPAVFKIFVTGDYHVEGILARGKAIKSKEKSTSSNEFQFGTLPGGGFLTYQLTRSALSFGEIEVEVRKPDDWIPPGGMGSPHTMVELDLNTHDRWKIRQRLGWRRVPGARPGSPIADAGPADLRVIYDRATGSRGFDLSILKGGTGVPLICQCRHPKKDESILKDLDPSAAAVGVMHVNGLRDSRWSPNLRISSISVERAAADVAKIILSDDEIQKLFKGLHHVIVLLAPDAVVHCSKDEQGRWLKPIVIYDAKGVHAPHGRIEDDAGYTSIVTAYIAVSIAKTFSRLNGKGNRLEAVASRMVSSLAFGLDRARYYREYGLPPIDLEARGEEVVRSWCEDVTSAAARDARPEGELLGCSLSTFDVAEVDVYDADWGFLRECMRRKMRLTAGSSKDPLLDVARSIALAGLKLIGQAERFPVAEFGKWSGADRTEIEGFQTLRRLMGKYLTHHKWNEPLAIAAFGPPGSGKSFGIRELAVELRKEKRLSGPNIAAKPLEFNLGGFTSVSELVTALHKSRDAALSGDVPLVMFDEFDATFEGRPHGWLKYLLAPIQDGEFRDGNTIYNIGRAIFVFVGGVSHSFADLAGQMRSRSFIEVKGPDFVSRLRGHVNIKGVDQTGDHDDFFILRRAAILYEKLKTQFGENFPPERIDKSVIDAYLTVNEFRHGVRSMEAIVQMSDYTEPPDCITKSSLPPADQLDMHTDAVQFLDIVNGFSGET